VEYTNLAGEYWYSLYTDFTPLSSLVLPLEDFIGVDIKNLHSIKLELESVSGCIVVRSVSLVK